MRTVTIIGAALVTASIGLTAAAIPPGQDTAAPKEKAPSEAPKAKTLPEAKTIRRQLEIFGSRDARIGVSVADITPGQTTTGSGAVVQQVASDSPAERAGIKTGDVVTTFDGERVRSAKQLARLVAETAPGRTIAATVLRDGKSVDVQLTPERGDTARFDGEFAIPPMAELELLPEMNFDHKFRFDGPGGGDLFEKRLPDGRGRAFEFYMNPSRGRLGVTLQELSSQLADYFGAKAGVLVSSVEPESPAARAGLKAGDVITAITGEPVDSPGDVMRAVARAGDGSDLTIAYTRDHQSMTATAKLEPREKREKPEKSGRPI